MEYEDEDEHRFTEGEAEHWVAFIRESCPALLSGAVLDIGCGTGLLTMLLAQHGVRVTGIDNDAEHLRQAKAKLDDVPKLATRIEYVPGDAFDPACFGPSSFDWIASRQAVCYLRTPVETFRLWLSWLRPGGGIFLVDGFWSGEGWRDNEYPLGPFATLTSPDVVGGALGAAASRSAPAGCSAKSTRIAIGPCRGARPAMWSLRGDHSNEGNLTHRPYWPLSPRRWMAGIGPLRILEMSASDDRNARSFRHERCA